MTDVERDLVVPGDVPLSGTMHLPSGFKAAGNGGETKLPAVLFIHGSGPLDRNENARSIKLNVFNYLAEELGKIGFASFRYDKRGIAKSKGNYIEAGFWDLVDDATRALTFLKDQPEIDAKRVILIGHSEGCYIAPIVNQKEPVAGMVLLMASADPLDKVLAYQSELMDSAIRSIKGFRGKLIRFVMHIAGSGSVAESSHRFVEKIRETTKPVIRYKLTRMNAKWYREHFAIIPREIYSSVTCPVLVIGGSKDMQVRPADAKTVSELVRGPCEWHIIEGEAHILRKDSGEGPSILHYKKLVKESVDPEIAKLTGHWLARIFLDEGHLPQQ
jgi:hypothetical protein